MRTSCRKRPGRESPDRFTWSPPLRPVLVRVQLQSLRGRDDVAQIDRVAEWVLVELGDAVQLALPAAQLGDVRFERDPAEILAVLDHITDPVVQPLSRMPVRHVD